MDMTELLQIGPFQTSYLELVAVTFGLACVWFMKKESLWAFPTGIVNVLIYVYIFIDARLYANAGINGFFFIMSTYGWYNWSRKDNNDSTIRITHCSKQEMWLNVLAVIVFFLILRFVLGRVTSIQMPGWIQNLPESSYKTSLVRYTEMLIPIMDALTTAVYIVGQWLLSRKKIENWILWISADSVMIGVCAWEGLYFTSFQYFIFTIIAVLGYREWRAKLAR